MALVKTNLGGFAKIKVIGIGGGGGNAIDTMITEQQIVGVDFIAVNTDAQALLKNKAELKLQIGENVTRGLGSGADPEIGAQSGEESREKIKDYLADTDMVFVTYGLGGGTGTGAGPIIAEIAREEIGALTVAIVTKPFAFEGARRMSIAEEGIAVLKEKVDTLIVIPNQRLLDVVDRKVSLLNAFKMVDSVLNQGVKGIADIITMPGLINVDFADVKAIMESSGSALMGIGHGTGEDRAVTAARTAISSPLLELSIEGAKGILFNIVGGDDITMTEVDEAAQIISQTAATDANIIFGAAINKALTDEIQITVIATGFDDTQARLAHFTRPSVYKPPQGLTGEKTSPIPQSTPQPAILEENNEENEEEQSKPDHLSRSKSDEDDFDIPAFLRNIRK
jgi:cell division protein FtsZ